MTIDDNKTRGDGDAIARAKFVGKETVEVHFNPESLSLTFGNSLAQRGTNGRSSGETGPAAEHQQANTFAATLSMKLLFDTTLTGQDVRRDTIKLQALLRPTGSKGQEAQVVTFSWGKAFKFTGTFASYSETLDYFSASGVPLRASVDLSMTENKVLAPDPLEEHVGVSGSLGTTLEIGAQSGVSVSGALGGDSFSARAIAEFNGEASVRRLSGAALELDAEIELRGAIAFATGAVSVGAGAGVSFGASLGVGAAGGVGLALGAAADFGASGGAAFGAGLPAVPGLGFGTGFGGDSSTARGSTLPGVSAGVAVASFGFAGTFAPADGALTGPARSFALDVASRRNAAAAAGVRGASSGLLSPAVGPSQPGSGVTLASAAYARRVLGDRAFAARDPSPTALEGPVWGSRASAGVPATFGAFAGLQARAVPPRIRRRIEPDRLMPRQPDAALRADDAAIFDIGGRALGTQASGLNVDVGLGASLRDRIRFDEE